MKKNTFKFLRYVYRIPQGQGLTWALLVEPNDAGSGLTTKLGVRLLGTNKVLDLSTRRCVTANDSRRNTYDAKRISLNKEEYLYKTEEGYQLILPKSYVGDLHFRSIYTKELVNAFLL